MAMTTRSSIKVKAQQERLVLDKSPLSLAIILIIRPVNPDTNEGHVSE
jgi:hypothetical protein